MSKVLITGGTGFIGRHLISYLLERNKYEIYCLARDDKFYKSFNIDVNVIKGDLLYPSEWEDEILTKVRPDVVVHLAALAPVRYSWARAVDYMNVNYFGTMNLVDVLKHIRNPDFLLISYSTAEVLGGGRRVNPATPYAISKYAAEQYVKFNPYVRSLIVRPCNTFDRSLLADVEEAKGYFVEKAILQLLQGGELRFDGYPDRRRTWMHVSDHVKAIEILIEKGVDIYSYLVYNYRKEGKPVIPIAPDGATASCEAVVAKLCEILGYGKVDVTWGLNPRPYDPKNITLDGFLMYEVADMVKRPWKPMTLTEGLKKAVENWRRVLNA